MRFNRALIIGTCIYGAARSTRVAPDEPMYINPYHQAGIVGSVEYVKSDLRHKSTSIFWEKDGCKLGLTGIVYPGVKIDPNSVEFQKLYNDYPSACIDMKIIAANLKNEVDVLVSHVEDSAWCKQNICQVKCGVDLMNDEGNSQRRLYGFYEFYRRITPYKYNPIKFSNGRVWDHFVTDDASSSDVWNENYALAESKLVVGICDYIAKQSVAVYRSLGIKNSFLSPFVVLVEVASENEDEPTEFFLKTTVPNKCIVALTLSATEVDSAIEDTHIRHFIQAREDPLYDDDKFTGYIVKTGGASLLRCVDLKFSNEDIALAHKPPADIDEISNNGQRGVTSYAGAVEIRDDTSNCSHSRASSDCLDSLGRLKMDCLDSNNRVYATYFWYPKSTAPYMSPLDLKRSLSKRMYSSLMKLAFKSAKAKYFANTLKINSVIEKDSNLRRIARMFCNVLAHRHASVKNAIQKLSKVSKETVSSL